MLDKSFVKRIRKEALAKRSIKIGTRIIDLGTEGPIILPTGKLWLITAEVRGGKWGKHYVLVSPNLDSVISRKQAFLRIDSGCLSGVAFGDMTCDCLHQLRKAQNIILKSGGVIVHIPSQDGRGWEEYKMANQRLMHECNIDTIDAAVRFYGDENLIDSRTYDESALILKSLGFPDGYKFTLGTQNKSKIATLLEFGFVVDARPVEIDGLGGIATKNLDAKYQHWGLIKEEENERN